MIGNFIFHLVLFNQINVHIGSLVAISATIFLVQTSTRSIYLIKISINVASSIRKNQGSSILEPPVVYLFQTSAPGNKLRPDAFLDNDERV